MKAILQNKKYLLYAGSLLLLLISYKFAFKNTIEEWQQNKQLKARIQESTDLSFQPGFMNRKSKNLSVILNRFKQDTASFRITAISEISAIGQQENVKLSEVPTEDAVYHTDHLVIQKLKLEGDFFSLLKVLQKLEQSSHVGFLRSVQVSSVKQRSAAGELQKLVLEIYVEILKE